MGFQKKLQPLHYVVNYSDYIKMYQDMFNNVISDPNTNDKNF